MEITIVWDIGGEGVLQFRDAFLGGTNNENYNFWGGSTLGPPSFKDNPKPETLNLVLGKLSDQHKGLDVQGVRFI